MKIPVFKMLFRFLRARGSEGSTWAGISVIGLFLNQLTAYDIDPLLRAVYEALPAALSGNWIGFLIVVLPAIVAVLKKDKADRNADERGQGAQPQTTPQQQAAPDFRPPGQR